MKARFNSVLSTFSLFYDTNGITKCHRSKYPRLNADNHQIIPQHEFSQQKVMLKHNVWWPCFLCICKDAKSNCWRHRIFHHSNWELWRGKTDGVCFLISIVGRAQQFSAELSRFNTKFVNFVVLVVGIKCAQCQQQLVFEWKQNLILKMFVVVFQRMSNLAGSETYVVN